MAEEAVFTLASLVAARYFPGATIVATIVGCIAKIMSFMAVSYILWDIFIYI